MSENQQFPTFEEFSKNYDITARMPFLLENKKYQKYMSKQRGERTPDEKPITAIRPKESPCIIQNDGYGNTPFKANLLLFMAILCVVMFAITLGFWLCIKMYGL